MSISCCDWLDAHAPATTNILTAVTLVVLCFYAWDTRKIARASVKQLEKSQMPFLAVAMLDDIAGQVAGWAIVNQGFGPALNIVWKYGGAAGRSHDINALASGDVKALQNLLAPVLNGRLPVEITYQSLSGLNYQTLVTWQGEHMKTIFRTPNGE